MIIDVKEEFGNDYIITQYEDGIDYIQTLHKPNSDGFPFDVYAYSDTHLAACLPPNSASQLLDQYPEVFSRHQSGGDATILIFEVEQLEKFADKLRLRKRKRLPEAQRKKCVKRLKKHQFKPHVRVRKWPWFGRLISPHVNR